MLIAILGILAVVAAGIAVTITRALEARREAGPVVRRLRITRWLSVAMSVSWGLTAGLGSAALYQAINALTT